MRDADAITSVNDAVIFRSSKFSLESPIENGVSYDLPLGDDIAAYLAKRLQNANPSCAVGSVTREDWGSVLDVSIDADPYSLSVHWLGYTGTEDAWGIQFTKRNGCFALFSWKHSPSECRPLQTLVARIMIDDPETFFRVEWLSQSDFHSRQKS